jgi:hypothetical protein
MLIRRLHHNGFSSKTRGYSSSNIKNDLKVLVENGNDNRKL